MKYFLSIMKYISLSTLMVITCLMSYSIFFGSLLDLALLLIIEIISVIETYIINNIAKEAWNNGKWNN